MIKGKKILIHNYLFVFGFVYYLICPFLFGYYNLFDGFPGMHLFYANYPKEGKILPYLILSILLFLSFLTGSLSAKGFTKNNDYIKDYKNKPIGKVKVKRWFVVILLIFNNYYILSNASILFSGYSNDYSSTFLGGIATFNNIYLFLWLYTKFSKDKIGKFLLLLLLENSIILLGMGSRMFVLIPVVAVLIFLIDNHRITKKTVITISITFVLLFLCVGVLRESNTITLETLAFIGCAEPMFTWISASSFINNNASINLIEFPAHFIGTFISIIPSILFPNKGDFISDIPYSLDNPLGACSILPLLFGNFGLFGAPVMMFLAGFLLTVLRYKRGVFFTCYYYCCCSVIPFLLFRDMQSTNKLVFSVFLIYPAIALIKFFKTKIGTLKSVS